MSEIRFATSGTTGEPVGWLRTPGQLDSEARLLASTVFGEVDRIITFAPPRHLYGRLLGVELPRLTGVPVHAGWTDPLRPVELDPRARTLLVCLPSTWLLLRHQLDALRGRPVVAVHSTGPPTAAAYEVVERLRGSAFRAVELLGSTETGAVAVRAIDPRSRDATRWRLLPDVTAHWDGTGEQLLRVRSPRLARRQDQARPPESYRLPDVVLPVTERTFRYLGRSSRLVKVNGRRCDLGLVEELLRRQVPGVEVACLARADPVRGEHYDLYYTSADADRLGPEQVRARLAQVRGDLPAPRAVYRVAELPGSAGTVPGPSPAAGAAG